MTSASSPRVPHADKVKSVQALYCSGNDEPEDLLGGLDQALHLEWRSFTRLIVLIADAPCHGGKEFHDLEESPENARVTDPLRAETLLKVMSGRYQIDLAFCRIKPDTDRMVERFKQLYNDPRSRRLLRTIDLSTDADSFLNQMVMTIRDSVIKSSMR